MGRQVCRRAPWDHLLLGDHIVGVPRLRELLGAPGEADEQLAQPELGPVPRLERYIRDGLRPGERVLMEAATLTGVLGKDPDHPDGDQKPEGL
jgi:hypothetical protein